MLVTDLINVRYLSGFTGSAARCWSTPTIGHRSWPPTAATAPRPPGRHPTCTSPSNAAARATLIGEAAAAGARRVGFEAHVVTVDQFDALAAALPATATERPVELVRASNTVEALREVKDAGEVALLRLACEAADAA